jgi:3-hydroxymyristoyl/3-hydroxydecanoyl-(acyl carrier protein) dehydratase
VRIPWGFASLDGHFPRAPIVAGVAQLHFAMRAIAELLGEEPALGSLEALKFHDVLLPGQEALLRVELPDQGRFQFSLRDAERPERSFASSRGRLERR